MMKFSTIALQAGCALALPAFALAQTPAPTDTVVITGSVQPRAADELPQAVSVVPRDALRLAGPMINLSEALVQVPGLVVANRSNYAQDLQISSRGFGARAGFGVRGIRLYADGIPAAGPDGQGQVSHFDIAGAQRVEVLRGPFSVLYGNSSGGVIASFSAPAVRAEAAADVDVGSFGLRQGRLALALPLGQGLELRAAASKMEVDGFRPNSAAEKTQINLRLGWRGARDTVTVLLNDLDQPAQDPLGLTREQFERGPDQTASVATQFRTRKLTRQSQLGASWRHRFDGGALREGQFALYGLMRDATQWLAIPVATQANPRHSGGVIDFDRRGAGADARLVWAWPGVELVTGLAADSQHDDRRGYENFTGSAPDVVLGAVGRQRRDEVNRARSRDGYAQADIVLADALHLGAGLRSGRVELAADDRYLANGNDSGALEYDYTNPVVGLRWQAAPGLQVHASVARGFESPTLGELAYRADGTGGFNAALRPQTSRQAEAGIKWRAGAWDAQAALFEVHTADEIGVATNSGGRSAFQNVGRTLRRGVEVAGGWRAGAWRAQASASTLHAVYRDSFKVCAGVPCSAANVVVPAGNRIAGAPRGSLWATLAWAGGAWGDWALEARAQGRSAVNDRNTDFAAGYGVAAARWSREWALGGGLRLQTLLRVDNLFDRHHVGSLIVNDANGRFFEPGAPRSTLLALRLVAAL